MSRMKKILAVIICMLLAFAVFACGPESEPDPDPEIKRPGQSTGSGPDVSADYTPAVAKYNDEIGEFIEAISFTYADSKWLAENVCNDSGMDGWFSWLHRHSASTTDDDASTKMWVTTAADNSIYFDLQASESLGKIYVWNLNRVGMTNAGLRDVKIYYSNDKLNWQQKMNGTDEIFTLAEAANTTAKQRAVII